MENKYKEGQQVEIFVSTGYMGQIKKQRVGIIKKIVPTQFGLCYLVETRTETGRVSTLNRNENEIIGLSSSMDNKVVEICKSIIASIGLSGLKELNIPSSDIKFLKTNQVI